MLFYIDPIRTELDEHMHRVSKKYLETNTPSNSPRWINFGDFNPDTKVLTLQSTQRNWIKFWVKTEFHHVDCSKFWEQFRQYRTDFLEKNYPSINTF